MNRKPYRALHHGDYQQSMSRWMKVMHFVRQWWLLILLVGALLTMLILAWAGAQWPNWFDPRWPE